MQIGCPTMIKILSLNVLFDGRIEEKSEYHFNQRWQHIERFFDEQKSNVILLQEVNIEFLKTIELYSEKNNLFMHKVLYHTPRKCYLVTLSDKDVKCNIHSIKDEFNKGLSIEYEGFFIMNVHLPLDIKLEGHRLNVSKKLSLLTSKYKNSCMIGDYNMIPKIGDKEQTQAIFLSGLKLIKPDVKTTFYGFPHENERFQKFNNPAVLDMMATNCDVKSIKCIQKFIKEGLPLSDHFPLVIELVKTNKYICDICKGYNTDAHFLLKHNKKCPNYKHPNNSKD